MYQSLRIYNISVYEQPTSMPTDRLLDICILWITNDVGITLKKWASPFMLGAWIYGIFKYGW